MTRNEKLLTVTDENEEKLRSLIEKAKTWAQSFSNSIIRLLQKNLKKFLVNRIKMKIKNSDDK